MDIEYEKLIKFDELKGVIKERRTTVSYVEQDAGLGKQRVSRLITGWGIPLSDVPARIASVLGVPVSRIMRFEGIRERKWFGERTNPYIRPDEPEGKLTYEPLRFTMNMYLDYYFEKTGKEKTVSDLYDMIEPCRRRNGIKVDPDISRLSVEKRFGVGYKSKRERKYVAKGLTPETRRKLKNDEPVNLRTIYDLCSFFGCSVDWIMSYK